ncbi:hypothetical protein AG0111_0g11603 [Alternaria gaisen]|uniref:Uncharacterized protein n=1 Tax=Alternaria gaisen TaxID=167740 RepID=A0ACB6F7F7_9PLEO|nr:hypothetical protein AG0111_0g11603 [Alternaria gaisen]
MAVDASQDAASLPYHELGIVVILVLASFLLLLNVVNAALDRVLYCGLLGQVLVGIAWGTPGAKWLSESLEETVVQLGYLGLILLVYEGGLSTSFQSLKANLLLSSSVALTEIRTQTAFTVHTLTLIGLVAGATYAGTSNLFAAYIAGASNSWWDSDVPHPASTLATTPVAEKSPAASGSVLESSEGTSPDASKTRSEQNQDALSSQPTKIEKDEHVDATGGAAIYHHYYHPAVSKILQPFFFASIGFSIPIMRMFRGAIVWRGIVYAVLMAFAKVVCGLWLVRFSVSTGKRSPSKILSKVRLPSVPHLWGKSNHPAPSAQAGATTPQVGAAPPHTEATPTQTRPAASSAGTESEARSSPNPPKPFSLHPPLILAFAMCARGEIGFLISGVAESQGVFGETSGEPTDIFLVVTWAIVLCTILGPLAVGLSVRRVKELQARKKKQYEGAEETSWTFGG